MLDLNILYNMDCMDGMKQFPDNYFDLAIVDPPYFSGPEKREYYGKRISTTGIERRNYHVSKEWKVPDDAYFKELFRVSKNQIVWGCNYYNYLFPGSGRIIWDKCNGASSFSDCEIAYCSLHDSVRLFRYMWNGMMQGKSISEGHIMQGNKSLNEHRIHPTQKPVALYEWLITRYAKKDDIILDTHVGSASSLIACHNLNYAYVGFEIDKHYYELATRRMNEHFSQLRLF